MSLNRSDRRGAIMNILYYLKEFPKISESFILNEIYALERAGHSVAVFALSGEERDITHTEFGSLDAHIHYAGPIGYDTFTRLVSSDTLGVLRSGEFRSSGGSINTVRDYIRTLECLKFVSELGWDVDVVHTHFATDEKFACVNVSDHLDVPFTITTHAFDIFRDMNKPTRKLLDSADRVVTISEYNRNYLLRKIRGGTPIDLVHAGIRMEKFSPTDSPSENRVLTVARFIEKKGLHYALEAVAIAAREIPELEYHLIGSGPLYEELVRTAAELGIKDNVTFLDNVSDERLIAEYNEARSFLLPCVITSSGERDGIPVALMEAMAMNTPPVSTTVSGIPELINHGADGYLTRPREPEDAATALLKLLRNDSEWSAYCRRGRKKVAEQFNVMKEVERLERSFRAAQGGPVAPYKKRSVRPLNPR